jgi:hypothetical protein
MYASLPSFVVKISWMVQKAQLLCRSSEGPSSPSWNLNWIAVSSNSVKLYENRYSESNFPAVLWYFEFGWDLGVILEVIFRVYFLLSCKSDNNGSIIHKEFPYVEPLFWAIGLENRLNHLGATPWRIQTFKMGEGLAYRSSPLSSPPLPMASDSKPRQIF